jgi:methylglutaconyl-CoA hydratase
MIDQASINVIIQDKVAKVVLNRPEVHNAFDAEMILELTNQFKQLSKNKEVRVILLEGNGPSFCAGADLNWMSEVSKYGHENNYMESLQLSECFYSIYTCSKPTIAKLHGVAIGGANGLLAACDICVATSDTIFSLSEVNIGLVPACIAPYVVKRVGEMAAREMMLTGLRFDGQKALELKLVNYIGTNEEVSNHINATISALKSSGPEAIKMCKKLLYQISNTWSLNEAKKETAKLIAQLRQSDEGQEGMKAFLNKRKPNWNL